LALELAVQILKISMKPKNWVCLAAYSKVKEFSHGTFTHCRLVEHYLIDRKYSVPVDFCLWVSSNKPLKLWHHGWILIVFVWSRINTIFSYKTNMINMVEVGFTIKFQYSYAAIHWAVAK